jgi:hypothetical protein
VTASADVGNVCFHILSPHFIAEFLTVWISALACASLVCCIHALHASVTGASSSALLCYACNVRISGHGIYAMHRQLCANRYYVRMAALFGFCAQAFYVQCENKLPTLISAEYLWCPAALSVSVHKHAVCTLETHSQLWTVMSTLRNEYGMAALWLTRLLGRLRCPFCVPAAPQRVICCPFQGSRFLANAWGIISGGTPPI